MSRWYALALAESCKLFELGVPQIEHLKPETYYKRFWRRGKPCCPKAMPKPAPRFAVLQDAGTHGSAAPRAPAGVPVQMLPEPEMLDDDDHGSEALSEVDLEADLLRVIEEVDEAEEAKQAHLADAAEARGLRRPIPGARPVEIGGSSGSGEPPLPLPPVPPPVRAAEVAARGGGDFFVWHSTLGHRFGFKAIMKGPADSRSIASWQCTCKYHEARPQSGGPREATGELWEILYHLYYIITLYFIIVYHIYHIYD